MDCLVIAEEPLTLERPFLISRRVGCDGAVSMGYSELAGGKADTGVIDTVQRQSSVDMEMIRQPFYPQLLAFQE